MMKDDNQNNDTFSASYNRDLEQLSRETVLNPAYQKKKLVLWTVRTLITITLYVLFWKHDWVKWTLVVTIPLSLFSLFMILAAPYLLKRKMESTGRKLAALDKTLREADLE